MGDIRISDAGGTIQLYHPTAKDAEMIDDRPDRDMRTGAIIAVLFFVLFLGWAAFARLDAAAYAPGRLTVAGQRQAVPHRDGGVVGAIFYKEGQLVGQDRQGVG